MEKEILEQWLSQMKAIQEIMDVDGIIEFERHGYKREEQ
jgi:hypothetical protein